MLRNYSKWMVRLTGLVLVVFLFSLSVSASGLLEIKVDPRIELLTIIQYLAGYQPLNEFDLDYKRDIEEYFADFKNHEVIRLIHQMGKYGFSYDAPPTLMLYLSPPPVLELQSHLPANVVTRVGGPRRLYKFMDELRSFARETDFMNFYHRHQGFYQLLITGVKETMGDEDLVADLENYYRTEQAGYHIIIAPLLHPGGYGPRLEREEGRYDIYNICGPVREEEGRPFFGREERFRYLAWHEFSHSFVNPVTARYREEINRYASLYRPIAEQMKEHAYADWETAFNEHLVRAVTTRLTYLKLGDRPGDQVLLREKKEGFIYIEEICEALKEYESKPDLYPTFADFYPEIIKVFTRLAQ